MFTIIDKRENEPRRVKHRETDKILGGIYTFLQGIPTEDPPVFVAPDLNKIPCVELNKIDGVALIHEQNDTKQILNMLVEEQKAMRQNLFKLEGLVSRSQPILQVQPNSNSSPRNQSRSFGGTANGRSNLPVGERLRSETAENELGSTSSATLQETTAEYAEETSDQQSLGVDSKGFTVVRNRHRRRR